MLLVLLLAVLILSVFLYPKSFGVAKVLTVIIAVVEGLRWESATDFWIYFYNYISILRPSIKDWERIDVAYFGLAYVFSSLAVPYIIFQLLYMAVTWWLYYKTMVFFKGASAVGILFLFCITIGLLGGERQWIAMSVFLYGLTFLVQGKMGCYVLAVTVASLFHVSALITLPLLLMNRKVSYWYWGSVMIVIVISPLIIDHFTAVLIRYRDVAGPVYASKIKYYLETNQRYQTNFMYLAGGVLRRLLPIAVLLYIKPMQTWRGRQLLLNISYASLLLYMFCVLNFEFLLGRLTIYYSLSDAIIFSWFAAVYIGHQKGKWIMAGLGVWATAIFIKSIMPYPELFIPYKTIFGTF